MISSLFCSGRLGPVPFPGYRYLEVERPVPDANGKQVIDRFLVKDALSSSSKLLRLPEGTLVVFKGRLEVDMEHGPVIVEEILESYRGVERF